MIKHSLVSGLLVFLLAAGCASTLKSAPEAMMAKDTAAPGAMMARESVTPDAMVTKDTVTPGAMMEKETVTPDTMMADDSMMKAVWMDTAFMNVASGKSFKISDYRGQVVLVELMAVWCSTCFQQQKIIQSLLDEGQKDLVVISLDIDSNENKDILNKYLNKNAFPWSFAVASPEVAREIGQLYGDQFLNPPSAPMLLIDNQGSVFPLPFGVKSVEALKKFVSAHMKN